MTRLGKADDTEIQLVEIIRLCGRSLPETSSYVLNKAARRCVTSCGIKDRGVRYRSRVGTRPFRKEICFYAIQATAARRHNPETGKAAAPSERIAVVTQATGSSIETELLLNSS